MDARRGTLDERHRSPTDHADEAINRVARKVNEGESIQDLNGYFYGLARLLFMETLRGSYSWRPCAPTRKNQSVSTLLRFPRALRPTKNTIAGVRSKSNGSNALKFCLNKLSAANRACIVWYYRDEKGVIFPFDFGPVSFVPRPMRWRISKNRGSVRRLSKAGSTSR